MCSVFSRHLAALSGPNVAADRPADTWGMQKCGIRRQADGSVLWEMLEYISRVSGPVNHTGHECLFNDLQLFSVVAGSWA